MHLLPSHRECQGQILAIPGWFGPTHLQMPKLLKRNQPQTLHRFFSVQRGLYTTQCALPTSDTTTSSWCPPITTAEGSFGRSRGAGWKTAALTLAMALHSRVHPRTKNTAQFIVSTALDGFSQFQSLPHITLSNNVQHNGDSQLFY